MSYSSSSSSSFLPSQLSLLRHASSAFSSRYGVDADVAGVAPGRVNLIGEHTDYNGGFVLPMAIPLITAVVGGTNDADALCHVTTLVAEVGEPSTISFSLPTADDPLRPSATVSWSNYVVGVVHNFLQHPRVTDGSIAPFRCVIASDVPIGGGLSSSASLEVATYSFLEALLASSSFSSSSPPSSSPTPREKALACQKAEHDFARVPCGIMDQYVSSMGKKDNALLIDCRSLDAQLVPLVNPEMCFLIMNSNVKHSLNGSEYPTRRKHCEEAAASLEKSSLREATMEELEAAEARLDPVVFRRARHVIGEIARTSAAVEALTNGDYLRVGQLMLASHRSLRDDFEVSCPELDRLVDATMINEGGKSGGGVYGSRMTGGGFGGCTVTLVDRSRVESVRRFVEDFLDTNFPTQPKPTFIVATPEDGCKSILDLPQLLRERTNDSSIS